jgi:hypothetical protein
MQVSSQLYGNLPGMRREKTNRLSNIKIKETTNRLSNIKIKETKREEAKKK